VTAVLDQTPETAADESAPQQPTASWLARTGAFSVDVLLGVAVIVTMALLTLSAPQRGWLWWVFTGVAVLVFLLMAINRLLLPTTTGWSLGRALFGIAVR
jgi:Mce-associated membrane protein